MLPGHERRRDRDRRRVGHRASRSTPTRRSSCATGSTRPGCCASSRRSRHEVGRRVAVAGVVTHRQRPGTARRGDVPVARGRDRAAQRHLLGGPVAAVPHGRAHVARRWWCADGWNAPTAPPTWSPSTSRRCRCRSGRRRATSAEAHALLVERPRRRRSSVDVLDRLDVVVRLGVVHRRVHRAAAARRPPSATATSGTEMTAPRMPASQRAGGDRERDDDRVERHLLAHHERLQDVPLELPDERDADADERRADSSPFAASATIIAMTIASGRADQRDERADEHEHGERRGERHAAGSTAG